MNVADKTRKLSFPFPAHLADRLRDASRRSGVPAAVLVRRAVARYLHEADDLLATLAAHPELVEQATPLEVFALAHAVGGAVPPGVERHLEGAKS